MTDRSEVQLRRLLWLGPATVAAAVLAVVLVQRLAVALLDPTPEFLHDYTEPILFTLVLVAIGVIVFAIVADLALDPIKSYRRIAFGALLVSLLPDVAVGMGWLFRTEDWRLATVFMIMHVAAWAVTVEMLTRLAVTSHSQRQ